MHDLLNLDTSCDISSKFQARDSLRTHCTIPEMAGLLLSSTHALSAFCDRLLKYLHHHYRAVLKEIHSVVLYMCVIIFVFPFGHECWCFPMWKWQIGALAIFMAWINNFILLKDIPHFGKPITMLFNVYMNFILLIYLPILLILTFAFPFYMLFIATLEVCSLSA